MEQLATNLSYWTNNPAFSQPSTWGYASPPSHYFWCGFGFILVWGLVLVGFRWVARVTTSGVEQTY